MLNTESLEVFKKDFLTGTKYSYKYGRSAFERVKKPNKRDHYRR